MISSCVRHFKKLDWILIIAAVLLVCFGLLSLYSSSIGKADFFNFHKQLVFFGIGFFLALLFSFFDFRVLRNSPYSILGLYFFCLFALAGLFFLAPEIRGVKSWYKVGFISLNPIEFLKIVLIILLAKYFSMRHIELYRIRHILLSGAYVLLPCLLIFFQPDLGSVLILVILWVGILLISGIKLRHFLILCLTALLACSLGWSLFLKDYQKERITNFVQIQSFGGKVDALGTSWTQIQSEIAIGSGGIFGKGITKGSQTQRGFLPEPQTDFIFAAISEETGLMGIGILLSLFLILIWRIFHIALNSANNFFRVFGLGFGILLFSQIFINIGMNLGLLPVIGIPLPFVSYGGSNLIMSLVGLGILQSIKIH